MYTTVMESMIMKPTIALLPDNLRGELKRRAAGGLVPDPLRPDPNRPINFKFEILTHLDRPPSYP
jgi:hypothetical protein